MNWIMDGHYEIEMENKKYPITIHLKTSYDPEEKAITG